MGQITIMNWHIGLLRSWKKRSNGSLATVVPNLDELESAMLREIRDEVAAAFHFAEISSFPSADEAFMGEYA